MDPITGFVTIVSLLSDFVAQRGAKEANDFAAFMAWLDDSRHSEIRDRLESSAATTLSIKALLNQSHAEIVARLAALDRTLASVASQMQPYRSIALIAHPSAELSQQAISILEQFRDSGATAFLEVKYQSDPTSLSIVDGPANGEISYSEPRFIEDDLTTLAELGLLGLEYNGRGDRMFKFRRSTLAFLAAQASS